MKDRQNRLLLLVFLLSVALCVWAWLFDIRLILFLPVIPSFCLTLLLCRTIRWLVVQFLPLLLIIGIALLAACGWLTATGWDSLAWAILLFGSIAPAVGCILALTFHHLRELYKGGDGRG